MQCSTDEIGGKPMHVNNIDFYAFPNCGWFIEKTRKFMSIC